MPFVFSDRQNNLFVHIYTNDHIPAHVHIFVGSKKSRDSQNIKISIGDQDTPPKVLLAPEDMKEALILTAWKLVAKEQKMLSDKWRTIHGANKPTSEKKKITN